MTVVSIHVGPRGAATLTATREVRAVPGKGLEGDRYAAATGTFSKSTKPGRQVTLIEIEAIEALARDCGIAIEPGEARRNIVTKGVALNHLVGREFSVGEVVLRGIRLCEPCDHLEKMTGKKLKEGLAHRGGLRADIVREGVIRTGDAICNTAPGN